MEIKEKDYKIENKFPFAKTHFQGSLFRINRPEVFRYREFLLQKINIGRKQTFQLK